MSSDELVSYLESKLKIYESVIQQLCTANVSHHKGYFLGEFRAALKKIADAKGSGK